VLQKKLVHQARIHNLVNSERIFIIPSLPHSLENLNWIDEVIDMRLVYQFFWNTVRVYSLCFKKRAPFLFLRLFCVLLTDLKNIWQYCNKGNLQQNTHFKFYIDAWYLVVTKTENTSSTATVDINIAQQNPKLKLVTQFESTGKDDQSRCSKCRPC